MGKVRFRCRDMVKIQFWDYNIVSGSTIYVDPGTHLTQQNQDMHILTPPMWKTICLVLYICILSLLKSPESLRSQSDSYLNKSPLGHSQPG